MPIFFTLIISFLSLSFRKYRDVLYWLFVFIFSSIFLWMNLRKDIFGDWAWYTEHYQFMRTIPFSEYIGHRFGSITIKWNEPTYYLMAYILSILTDGTIGFLALLVTVTIYYFNASSILKIDRVYSAEYRVFNNANVLAACLLFSVTFTLTTQLVRQEIAVAFFTASYAFMARQKVKLSVIWAIIAISCHQSAAFAVVVFLAPLASVILLRRYRFIKNLVLLTLPLVAALFGYLIATSGLGGDKDDGSVSTSIILMDFAIFLIAMIIVFLDKKLPAHFRALPITYLCFVFCLAVLASNPLAMLRLYFYADFVRGISLLLISSFIFRNFPSPVYGIYSVCLLAAALIFTEFRILISPFDFGGLFHDYMLAPLL